jgi:hypothetical protein
LYALLYLAITSIVSDAGDLIKEAPDPMIRHGFH